MKIWGLQVGVEASSVCWLFNYREITESIIKIENEKRKLNDKKK